MKTCFLALAACQPLSPEERDAVHLVGFWTEPSKMTIEETKAIAERMHATVPVLGR
jgi:hypothetical protein